MGSDANGDGCSDKITGLPSEIADLELPKGNEDALHASVKVVQDALQRGNAKAVRGVLKAFINKVAAQSGKKIPAGDAGTLPAVYQARSFVRAGGLMAHGPNHSEFRRRIAAYVDKVLKGANPGDLPIEQPTKFELIVNLKTAKKLDLTIPLEVLYRADKVIK